MKVYTLNEIADILRVSVYTVKNYIRDKKLKTIANGDRGAIRVSESELKRFIDGE